MSDNGENPYELDPVLPGDASDEDAGLDELPE